MKCGSLPSASNGVPFASTALLPLVAMLKDGYDVPTLLWQDKK
jgi:hypothetical protein